MSKSNFRRTADWLKACGKEPNVENLSVQIGCHLEEMAEFVQCVHMIGNGELDEVLQGIWADLTFVADNLKMKLAIAHLGGRHKIEVALDALCDCEVTGNGVAYLAGFDKEGADEAVLASNEAKLVDGKPVILQGGKIGKPEGWTAPDLTKFV